MPGPRLFVRAQIKTRLHLALEIAFGSLRVVLLPALLLLEALEVSHLCLIVGII